MHGSSILAKAVVDRLLAQGLIRESDAELIGEITDASAQEFGLVLTKDELLKLQDALIKDSAAKGDRIGAAQPLQEAQKNPPNQNRGFLESLIAQVAETSEHTLASADAMLARGEGRSRETERLLDEIERRNAGTRTRQAETAQRQEAILDEQRKLAQRQEELLAWLNRL